MHGISYVVPFKVKYSSDIKYPAMITSAVKDQVLIVALTLR